MELQNLFPADGHLLTAFAESRIGGRQENQDSYGCCKTRYGYLFTVCDGMGGGPGGKTASAIAVKEIVDGIANAESDEAVPNIIIKAIRRANMTIIERGDEDAAFKGMGATATVLLVSEQSAFVAHVGDSRVYQIRRRHKVFRTFDHSLVFEMVSQKVITEEQARLSAQSNVITRALGVKPDLEVDITELPYERGDRFMLCTDGIHGSMPEKELVRMVSDHSGTLGALVDDVATCVDNIGRSSGGGHDNLTLAMIEMHINSKLKEKMSIKVKAIIGSMAAMVAASLLLNVVQCSNSSGAVKALENACDTIVQLHNENTFLQHKVQNVNSLVRRPGENAQEAEKTLKEIKKILESK